MWIPSTQELAEDLASSVVSFEDEEEDDEVGMMELT